MEDIEVGEYVRTADGKIGTFVRYSSRKANSFYKCPADCFIKLAGRKSNLQCFRDYIVKHSKQLIDLVEVGDILEIEEEGYEEKYECLKSDKGLSVYIRISDYYKEIEDLKIKRVLTKEQFRQNSYEVGGEDE